MENLWHIGQCDTIQRKTWNLRDMHPVCFDLNGTDRKGKGLAECSLKTRHTVQVVGDNKSEGIAIASRFFPNGQRRNLWNKTTGFLNRQPPGGGENRSLGPP